MVSCNVNMQINDVLEVSIGYSQCMCNNCKYINLYKIIHYLVHRNVLYCILYVPKHVNTVFTLVYMHDYCPYVYIIYYI